MPDLCTLGDVKTWLGLDSMNIDSDQTLSRLISATSADFLGRIRRPGFTPSSVHTEHITVSNWQSETHQEDLFLKHYPVSQIAAVSVNGTDFVQFDENNPAIPGWFFDTELDPEDRQKVTLMGFYYPLFGTWSSPSRSIYRPPPARVIVTYLAGYDGNEIPEDVRGAIIEWVGYKKGLGDLQGKDQSTQWLQIGQFQQNTSIATSTVKMSGIDMPMSVEAVISKYQRPII